MEESLQSAEYASNADFIIKLQKKQRELEQKIYEWEILSENLEALKS